METLEITVQRRAGTGKSVTRKLRRGGLIPAVFYGPKRTAMTIGVAAEEFARKLQRLEGSHLIRLVNDGGSDSDLHDKMVLMREVQLHPVSGDVLHVDFYEVDLTERLAVSVPLHFIGKPAGVVDGGILQPILREIEVECLPTEIPEFIEVDVSALGIHEAIHVSDLTLPEGVTPTGEAGLTIVTVQPPTVEETKPAEAAEAAPGEAAPAEGAAPAAEPAETKGKKGAEG
jgi:large subunit ribosomal protein L25